MCFGSGQPKTHRATRAQLVELAPRQGAGHPDRSAAVVQEAAFRTYLGEVGQYISARRRQISIVAVGGIVNTLLLRTRTATQDVDFFTDGVPVEDQRLLVEAARAVRARHASELAQDWMNNHTILYVPRELRQSLVEEGYRQQAIVFQSAGLNIYAAPWSYAFVSKLDRISTAGKARDYDPVDAAAYLHQYLSARAAHQIRESMIVEWLQRFQLRTQGDSRRAALRSINNAYEQRFGSRPILQS
ncbi:Hypothetical protein D9617_11g009300 [Elsinoe fawcettii]|nr:Hypothetical protein D9617_11g009300 [Elsinoe fawcettii]